jgi:hypothetical protein
MQDNIKDILATLSPDIDQALLLRYISGNITDADKRTIELQMADDPFLNDAVEGLQQASNKTDIERIINELNKDFKRQLAHKKQHVKKRRYKDNPFIVYAAITLLILIFALVYFYKFKS